MFTLTLPVGARDHRRGPPDAPVTLVEYGDFECPYSGEAFHDLKEIQEEMGPQLLLVYRHFPITTTHPHAEAAALAAEAAGVQGKFWEMHDALFENPDALEEENLAEYARALELDLTRFDEDLRTRRHGSRIREDYESGVRSGVNGTPTFFINSVLHEGLFEVSEMLGALKHAAEARTAH